MKPTYCIDCKHVHQDTIKSAPWYWLCTRHSRLNEGFGFVTDHIWDKAPPFLYCKDVNAGACPLFERNEGSQMALGVEEKVA